ncbi:MAG: hypothetical protein HOW97_18020 [Catenulispora sp.]|nr:hypothetical protein [Catenulispora sp.]
MKSIETFPTAGGGLVTLETRTSGLRGTSSGKWGCTCGDRATDRLLDGSRLTDIELKQDAAAHAAECDY